MRISDWSSDVCSSDLAAVDEDDLAAGAEDDVGFARQILAMQPEAVAQCMDHPSDQPFRPRAAAPDPAYILAQRRRRKMVGPSLPPLACGRGPPGHDPHRPHGDPHRTITVACNSVAEGKRI